MKTEKLNNSQYLYKGTGQEALEALSDHFMQKTSVEAANWFIEDPENVKKILVWAYAVKFSAEKVEDPALKLKLPMLWYLTIARLELVTQLIEVEKMGTAAVRNQIKMNSKLEPTIEERNGKA